MTRKRKFLQQHPKCCFCGGLKPATEIDHQPAKILFPDKRRPKGLEFPACKVCNRQTAADEALLAFVCRFTGSHRPNAARDFHRLKDIVSSVNSAFPGLMTRIHPRGLWAPERGVWQRVGGIDVNQPEVHEGLCRIAAKLALAIYYQTKSVPAAPACRINCQWTHSQNAETFKSMQNIIDWMSNQATLQMGQWTTQESFFLKFHYDDDGNLFSAAIFHQSIALIAHLREPRRRQRQHQRRRWRRRQQDRE